MIRFKTLSYKNFLSVGNAPVEIDFEKDPRTLISGTNGNGKSTILSALTFALFGKPLKNITKPSLVNTINGKNCYVEVQFEVAGREYKVVRGIKPNVFEVYENGKMLDQTAVRDYQVYLEQTVLKTNFQAFTQTTIISVENYVPFMELRTGERRQFIEELLDISVFTTMNNLVKNQVSEAKERLKDVESHIASAKQRAIMQKKHIDQFEHEKAKVAVNLESKIEQYTNNIAKLQDETEDLMQEEEDLITKANEVDKRSALEKFESLRKQMLSTMSSFDDKIDFYKHTDNCPTCKQGISEEHREILVSDVEQKKVDVTNAIQSIDTKLKDINASLVEYENITNRSLALNKKVTEKYAEIRQLRQLKAETEAELAAYRADSSSSIDIQKAELKELAKQVVDLTKLKAEINEERAYQEVIVNLLKDSGIKATIIKQYIPVINKLVNKYLGMLDFFVSFELDENFNETIKARHRDTFTYHNFSAGERQRIDLAIMFTFRQVAKMKNSFNSNLLMLDEVLDASLDSAGIDNLFNIFDSGDLKDTNIFVISHRNKDTLADKFPGTIELDKVNGFTKVL